MSAAGAVAVETGTVGTEQRGVERGLGGAVLSTPAQIYASLTTD